LSEIENIVQDMKKSGFPLEVVAGTCFRNKGWTARHQVFYHDRAENKDRYVNIAAHKVIEKPSAIFRRLNYTVIAECKKSEKAWVFYTPPSPFLTEEPDLASIGYLNTIPSFTIDGIKSLLHNHYVAKPPSDRLGVASYVAFTGGRDSKEYGQIFSATNQVLRALQYQIEWARSGLRSQSPNLLMIFYPAIIFDGKMYEYVLDEKENPKLMESNYVKYEVAFQSRVKTDEFVNFLIDIITKNFLPEYLDILEEEMQLTSKHVM